MLWRRHFGNNAEYGVEVKEEGKGKKGMRYINHARVTD